MTFVVKSENQYDYDCTFPCNESTENNNCAFFSKVTKPTKIFEFIIDILSDPRYSSIITWDGSSGQFTIVQPHQVGGLWGDRNGRPNMTYQKFTRALRYYYHKKVLTKVRGRKYTYQFNIRELERQYGYQGFTFSRATSEPAASDSFEIPTIRDHHYHLFTDYNFPAVIMDNSVDSSLVFMVPNEGQKTPSSSYPNGQCFQCHFNF